MDKPSYACWRAELKNPTPPDRRIDRPTASAMICGFYRIEAARTKVSYPLAIFPQDGESGLKIIYKIGVGERDGQSLFSNEDGLKVHEFNNGTWFDAVAVTEAEYHKAMETGYWSDGFMARRISETEKLDLIPSTPASEGGNAPKGDDMHAQIVAKIEALVEQAKPLFPITTMEKATSAASIVEKLTALGKKGKELFEVEKAPVRAEAERIDAKWFPVKTASDTIKSLKTMIDSFTRAENARLKREADERAEAERKRLEDEARAAATQAGQEVDEAEVAAIAEQKLAAAPPPEPEKVVVRGSLQGRAVSLPKRKVGRITDKAAFIAALDGQDDFNEWLAEKANKLARANVKLAGMEIETQ